MLSAKNADANRNPPAATTNTSEEEDYDPFAHRVVEKPTTNFDTAVHCIKGSVGSGILAMPHAFRYSGTIVGVIGTLSLSIILTYAIVVLVRCMNMVCKIKKRPYMPLPFAMRGAMKLGPTVFRKLAPAAPIFVDFFLISYQLGICCSYLALISNTLKEILEPNVFKYEMDYRWYLFMILVPVLSINCIRSLKHLTPVSFIADVLTIVGITILIYYFVGTGPLKIEETTYFGTVVNYPLFFGTVMFALEAVGVVLACEGNMAKPQDFSRVFTFSMSFVIFIYTFFGFMGYIKYAEDIKGSITQTIPAGTSTVILQSLVAFSIFCSHPLQCHVPLAILWHNYLVRHITDKNKEIYAEYAMRAVVVSTTFLVVIVVRKFELIISFVGAFCISCLGLIFPSTMELCVLWGEKNYGPYNYTLIKDILGIILGLFLMLMGSYVAVLAVIEDL
uniref:Amino acid transporter transmembrane domain-containing protein n=1 Tax=Clastoptera arizonana TaxID=38151 RepID=A0A1B6E825_9HEMI